MKKKHAILLLFLSDLEILQFYHDSIIELLVKKFLLAKQSPLPLDIQCGLLGASGAPSFPGAIFGGDRGTCEPQDLKDLFVSREPKKNATAKGFAHFEDLRHSRVSPSFVVLRKPFPCIQRFPQIPICSMKTPIEFPPMLPGKVLFFLVVLDLDGDLEHLFLGLFGRFLVKQLRSRFPLAESLFQNCQVG